MLEKCSNLWRSSSLSFGAKFHAFHPELKIVDLERAIPCHFPSAQLGGTKLQKVENL
jgi:hypothetical protein